jgi:hypothetical protein
MSQAETFSGDTFIVSENPCASIDSHNKFSDYFLALNDKRKTLPSLESVREKTKRVSVSV